MVPVASLTRKGNYVFWLLLESISIILPLYNPSRGWEDIVIERFRSLQAKLPGANIALIIVNDGSAILDPSSVLALKRSLPEANWISYEDNRGKGYALRTGVEQAKGDIILYTDIDWPYEESSVLEVIASCKTADAIIGIRDAEYYKCLPPTRKRISRLLRKFNSWLLRLKVDDTQAGLKAFRQKVKPEFLKTSIDRYLFDLEFIYLISSDPGIIVRSVPIRLREGITFSKMNKKILLQELGNFMKIWFKKMW